MRWFYHANLLLLSALIKLAAGNGKWPSQASLIKQLTHWTESTWLTLLPASVSRAVVATGEDASG